ncbi:MAG: UDP-N-acetylmuramate dehydrogenase [bacterium]|nr:UDP-N-acetylmuramate dehydrogenase [bacterium]
MLLASLTTIQLGGNAKEYISCKTQDDITAALIYAKEKKLKIHVLGGGSNSIFADAGFDGLVIHIQTTGISAEKTDAAVYLTAQAGEPWDDVVQYAIKNNLTGIECLSGIPGSCGGTPFQNVGAYGQEVAQTISYVDVIDRNSLQNIRFTNDECNFGYRTSRFKVQDFNKYIILSVTFRLIPSGTPNIRYGELSSLVSETSSLQEIRDAVLQLRKKKSMLIDPADPNSISCGSFFTNPIISAAEFETVQKNISEEIPSYESAGDKKLSAAWLVEHAGFTKGTTRGNVGISEHHSLALVNNGGTTQALLQFANEIQTAVENKFNIKLVLEPLVIPS